MIFEKTLWKVAEVRDTSHKPDEIYGIIERLSPGSRKLELFGRMHNVQVRHRDIKSRIYSSLFSQIGLHWVINWMVSI